MLNVAGALWARGWAVVGADEIGFTNRFPFLVSKSCMDPILLWEWCGNVGSVVWTQTGLWWHLKMKLGASKSLQNFWLQFESQILWKGVLLCGILRKSCRPCLKPLKPAASDYLKFSQIPCKAESWHWGLFAHQSMGESHSNSSFLGFRWRVPH